MRLVCLYFLILFHFLFQNNNRGGYNVGDKTDKPATTAANQFNMVRTCSTVLPIICNNNQGLQILLMSGVTVTSTSQILESFWNIRSQVSQQKKPFSDFSARRPGMYTLS